MNERLVGHLRWRLTSEPGGHVISEGERSILSEELTARTESLGPVPPGTYAPINGEALPGALAADLDELNRRLEFLERSRSEAPIMLTTHAVQLFGPYRLECTVDRGRSIPSGLGLHIKSDDERLFNWEWFVIKSDTRATKLQEVGELDLTWSAAHELISLSRIDFTTDISFRLCVLGEQPPSPENVFKPPQRLLITGGSWLELT